MKKQGTLRWLRRHPLIVVVCCFALIDVLLLGIAMHTQSNVLRVSFLNVGQGDAVLIQGPTGNQILYDAGPPTGATLRALADELPFWDRSIDVVVLSHPDMDHIGGFPEVFKRYAIAVALEPGVTSTNGVYDESQAAIVREGAAHFIAKKGMLIDLGGGAVAEVLYPDHDTTDMETNSASIVLLIRYGETSFLLSGDLPKHIEEYLVGVYGEQLRANVVKIGHHGSRTSTSPYWLAAVQPDVAVISAGKENSYGHPHKEVIDTLAKTAVTTLITHEEKRIVFESDGTVVIRK